MGTAGAVSGALRMGFATLDARELRCFAAAWTCAGELLLVVSCHFAFAHIADPDICSCCCSAPAVYTYMFCSPDDELLPGSAGCIWHWKCVMVSRSSQLCVYSGSLRVGSYTSLSTLSTSLKCLSGGCQVVSISSFRQHLRATTVQPTSQLK